MRPARPGYSLIEALVVLVIVALLGSVVAGLLTAQLRLARATAERAVAREAARTATAVLGGEIRRMSIRDLGPLAPDTIAVRAQRGIAIPCATTLSGLAVRYTGDRSPDATKDSVLVVSLDSETAMRLLDSTPAPSLCSARPGEGVLLWRLPYTVTSASVLLLFEPGSYHLAAGALRYRTGAGGRQPLTPDVLRHPGSRFTGLDSGGLGFLIDAGQIRTVGHAPFPVAAR